MVARIHMAENKQLSDKLTGCDLDVLGVSSTFQRDVLVGFISDKISKQLPMVTLPPAKHRVLNLPETKDDSLELATAWLSWQSEQRSADVVASPGMLQDRSLQGVGAAGRRVERRTTDYVFSPLVKRTAG